MSNAISALTQSGIKSAYTSATYHKGKGYYASRKVVSLDVSHLSATESIINASVQGTSRYTVFLKIKNTKYTISINGECSCLKDQANHIRLVLKHY